MKTAETSGWPVRGAKVWPLSVPAYHALGDAGLIPENTELLYGFVYQKMPKSPLHSFFVQLLRDILLRILPGGFILRTEQPITCADSEPEPDLAVIKGRIEEFRLAHPRTAELVVEVCVSSHEYDRSKLLAYAAAGVNEIWLVLAPEMQIEVYRQPANGAYGDKQSVGRGGRLKCLAVPELVLEVNALFAE